MPTTLPLTFLYDPPLLSVYFQVYTDVSYCLDYYVEDISTILVVLSVPVLSLNPNPMYLPLPLPDLYLTHSAVTKVTRSVRYKHVLNRWNGKKFLYRDL